MCAYVCVSAVIPRCACVYVCVCVRVCMCVCVSVRVTAVKKIAWIRFELVAKAKELDAAKQLTVLPTLLRGKLLDHFVDSDDDTMSDLKKLHAAHIAASGMLEDPLSAAKSFSAHDQRPDEKVADFASAIKKLFRQAYPEERVASKVLLQQFLTGLQVPISQQLLLRGRPDQMENAIKDATEVEYALMIAGSTASECHVGATYPRGCGRICTPAGRCFAETPDCTGCNDQESGSPRSDHHETDGSPSPRFTSDCKRSGSR